MHLFHKQVLTKAGILETPRSAVPPASPSSVLVSATGAASSVSTSLGGKGGGAEAAAKGGSDAVDDFWASRLSKDVGYNNVGGYLQLKNRM